MVILETLKKAIHEVGIKEVARRSGLSASTVSRVNSGQIKPSLEVAERISNAVGLSLELNVTAIAIRAPRLRIAKQILLRLKKELQELGIRRAIIFGSVARGEDGPNSDIDVYLDFGTTRPKVAQLLRAEGRVIEAFGENKVDIVSLMDFKRNPKLQKRIETDGVSAF